MSRRASRCSTSAPRRSCSSKLEPRRAARSGRDEPDSRARPRAGDRDRRGRRPDLQGRRAARRSASATLCRPGSSMPAASMRRSPSCRGALGIAPDDTIEQVEQDIVAGPLAAVVANGRRLRQRSAEQARKAIRSKRDGLRRAGRPPARTRVEAYLAGLLRPSKLQAAQEPRHARHRREASGAGATARRGAASASCALLERRKAIACRDRTAALITIADAVIARYQAEKDRRGLLDYDDLIDKTLALLDNGRRRLGALQARPRHRPRADRRGAGHQPEAVGDHPRADRRVLRRRGRARGPAHDLRGRRREAVDLLVPGRGAARIRRDAARTSRRSCRGGRAEPAIRCRSAIRSAPARTCWARSTRCSARPEAFSGLSADAVADRARGAAGRGARPGRDLGR